MRLAEVLEPKMTTAFKRLVMDLSHVVNPYGWKLEPTDHPDSDLADEMNELNDLEFMFDAGGWLGGGDGQGLLLVGQHTPKAGPADIYVALKITPLKNRERSALVQKLTNVFDQHDALWKRKLYVNSNANNVALIGWELKPWAL